MTSLLPKPLADLPSLSQREILDSCDHILLNPALVPHRIYRFRLLIQHELDLLYTQSPTRGTIHYEPFSRAVIQMGLEWKLRRNNRMNL